MASRLLLVALLAAVISATAVVADHPKNVIIGARQPKDHLIQREQVDKASSWLQSVKVTRTFAGDQFSSITQVRLLDLSTNGHGAVATITAGGPGYKFVTVQFKSEWRHGIRFVVELYGR